MKTSLQGFFVASLVVVVLTPLVRRLALHLGAVALPGGRHVHQRLTPRLGGLAMCIGFYAALTVLHFVSPAASEAFRADPRRMIGLLGGGAAICAVGVVDDVLGIRAHRKLALQILVAAFSYGCGLRIDAVHVPLAGDVAMGTMSLPVTVLWFVAVINAVNLIDGLDGLAAGIVCCAGATGAVVSWLSGDVLAALVSGALAGSTLAFLHYNFHPARIFMGDSGSYFLGYVVAATALLASPRGAPAAVSLAVPILVLAVPILDTTLVILRRVARRRSPFAPDRGHIHHALLDRGLTQRRAVLTVYAVCAVLGLSAFAVTLDDPLPIAAALTGSTLALIALAHAAGRLRAARELLRRFVAVHLAPGRHGETVLEPETSRDALVATPSVRAPRGRIGRAA